jgi:hypothetical protein
MLTMSPPPAPRCLEKPYPASQKGGTLIAEDITELDIHLELVADPDGYRPARCHRCQHPRLHTHDFRERQAKRDPERAAVPTRRYVCTHPDCQAIWHVLPLPLAPRLHHGWQVVQTTLEGNRPTAFFAVPQRTVPDRGAAYLARSLRIICGELVMHLRHTQPGDAAAKGVVEKWHRTWRDEVGDAHPARRGRRRAARRAAVAR